MDTFSISPSKEIEREEHVASELLPTFASTPTSSTSTWTEAEQEEFGKLDESEQIQQIYDFMKSQSEKRRAERSVDREFIDSQAQVVIKEKLSKISDILNT